MNRTLEHIARLAGVSRATVSRVINNYPYVRPEVRERVRRIIHQEGYQPLAAARSLVTKRTQVIGLIIPQGVISIFKDPVFPHLMHGIANVCNARGCHLMLSLFSQKNDQDKLYRQVVRSGYLDGVIVAATDLDDPLITRMMKDSIPFVTIGRYPDEQVNWVDSDNVTGARLAVEHLLRLGHRRIATITGSLNAPPGIDRFLGYRQAMEAAGLPVDEALVAYGSFTEDSGRLAMQQLLPQRPSAVFAACDVMAIGAMQTIKAAGQRVPQDIAVVGFDDLPLAAIVEPPLTTMHQMIDLLGVTAAEILLDMIEGNAEKPRQVAMPTELVIRASCGAKPAVFKASTGSLSL